MVRPCHAEPVPGTASQQGPVLERQSNLWRFTPTQPALSTLTAKAPQTMLPVPPNLTNSFTLRFRLQGKTFNEPRTIVEIPNAIAVRLHHHDPLDRDRQNYPAFRMSDGSVPVLEAAIALHSVEHPEWKEMVIGIPLAMLPTPEGAHDVTLQFTGVNWTLYVDGELLDNDFPFGYPQWPDGSAWKIDQEFVDKAEFYAPAIQPQNQLASASRRIRGIQYWMPRGHNNWVGDVETIFYNGRYHVFYLYDRRHHQSKFGCGAHYFEHLSTTDFITWTEHEAATPLDEQWECIGTGVPFVFKDQLCLSFGWHTTRIYPEEKTTLPAQREHLKRSGSSGTFRRETTPGVPAGATYSISTDGIGQFRKSQIMFHPCENPSVYTDPQGKLRMLANYRSSGTWESDTVDGGWRCVNPNFPSGGDCTVFFRWGSFDYIIGGFTGLWRKPADAPESAYEDIVREGLDFYDGSNVPAVTRIGDGRFLMASWIPVRGWGGVFLLRELIQFADGRIGSKWMNEVIPALEKPNTLGTTISQARTFPVQSSSFLLSFTVHPNEKSTGRFSVSFLPEADQKPACELQISLRDRRAQFGPSSLAGFASKEKSLREGASPQHVGNYAIENLIGTDKPFSVRMLVKSGPKLGGSLIDAEIAGQRTMISYRRDLTVYQLGVRTEGVELNSFQVTPLSE